MQEEKYNYRLPRSGVGFNFKITCFSDSNLALDVIFENDVPMKIIEKVIKIDSKKGIQFTAIKDNCVSIGFAQNLDNSKNAFKALLNELDLELKALNQKREELEKELIDLKH